MITASPPNFRACHRYCANGRLAGDRRQVASLCSRAEKLVDWSLLWDDGRRREQLKFGRNSRNFDARLRDLWSTIVRLAEAELIRLSLAGLSGWETGTAPTARGSVLVNCSATFLLAAADPMVVQTEQCPRKRNSQEMPPALAPALTPHGSLWLNRAKDEFLLDAGLAERPRITPATRALNTRRAYESDWRQFSSWLRRQGFPASSPDPQTVGLYLAACADGAGRMTRDERRLAGAAAVGDRLALSTIRPAARHPGSPYRHRAGRHSPRPWLPAESGRRTIRRRSSGHAGHVGQ